MGGGYRCRGVGRPELGDSVVPLQGEGLAGGALKGTVAGYFAGGRLVATAGFGAAKWVVRYRALIAHGADRTEVMTVA